MSRSVDPRIIECFHTALGRPDIVLDTESTMESTEGWDSFAHINLVLALEDTFGVEFESDEIPELNEMVRIVEALRARGALGAS
jgi:acyl carrier protein